MFFSVFIFFSLDFVVNFLLILLVLCYNLRQVKLVTSFYNNCMKHMSAWLRGEDKVREKGGPTWSSLATALDAIEEKFIASNIRDKYCVPSS